MAEEEATVRSHATRKDALHPAREEEIKVATASSAMKKDASLHGITIAAEATVRGAGIIMTNSRVMKKDVSLHGVTTAVAATAHPAEIITGNRAMKRAASLHGIITVVAATAHGAGIIMTNSHAMKKGASLHGMTAIARGTEAVTRISHVMKKDALLPTGAEENALKEIQNITAANKACAPALIGVPVDLV
jgi:hypothetical protein